jgi:hypothetical protein
VRSLTAARSVRTAVKAAVLAVGLAGVAVPIASAEPITPVEPGVPAPEAIPAADLAAAPATATSPEALAVVAQAAAPASVAPPDGVSHLPSPDSLPPGTTKTAPEHPTLGYLKDVWNALRTEEVTASDALLLLAQRPVNDSRIAESVPQGQAVPAGAPAPVAVPAPGDAPLALDPAAEAPALPAPAVVLPAAEAPAPAPAG